MAKKSSTRTQAKKSTSLEPKKLKAAKKTTAAVAKKKTASKKAAVRPTKKKATKPKSLEAAADADCPCEDGSKLSGKIIRVDSNNGRFDVKFSNPDLRRTFRFTDLCDQDSVPTVNDTASVCLSEDGFTPLCCIQTS